MIQQPRQFEYDIDFGERARTRTEGVGEAESAGERSYEQETYRARMRGNRPITQIVRDLRDEATLLMRQQMELFKAEMSEKVSTWSRNSVFIAIGGFVAYAGFLFLLLAATAGVAFALIAADVAEVHAMWLAPLIVGLVVAIVGYVLIQKGISTLKHTSAMPKRTARTLREDKQWLQTKAESKAS